MAEKNNFEEILGYAYPGVSKFFTETINEYAQKYTHVILMARRCILLYEIFNRNFAKPQNIKSNLNLNEIKSDDSVLIVDDIIIHGRTVGTLYQKLKEEYHVSKVNVLAYYRYVNSLEINGLIDAWIVTSSEWRDLSDKLVNVILHAKMPYVTYVPTFKQKNKSKIKFNKNRFSNRPLKNNANKTSTFTGSVYFDNNFCEFPLLRYLCKSVCIREYKYYEMPNHYYIPMVFINNINKNIIESFFYNIKNILNFNIYNTVYSQYSSTYKSELITLILSFLYGKYMFDACGELASIEYYPTVLKYSFTQELIDTLNSIDIETIRRFFNTSLTEKNSYTTITNPKTTSSEKNPEYLIKKYKYEYLKDDCDSVMFACLSALHMANENSANNISVYDNITNKTKRYSYNLNLLFDFVANSCNTSDAYLYYAALISLCDVGYASYWFREHQTDVDSVITSVIDDGEQVYKINCILAEEFVKTLRYLYNYTLFFTSKTFENIFNDFFKYMKSYCKDIETKIFKKTPIEYLKNAVKDINNMHIIDYVSVPSSVTDAAKHLYDCAREYVKAAK